MNFSFKKILKKKENNGTLHAAILTKPSLGNKNLKRKINFSYKQKKFQATSGAKYGLIVGDEGAILIYMVGKEVKSRNFIAHASSDNLKEFGTILAKDTKAPLFLVIDSMDQNFIQQSLPPISSLGVRKLIKRRLNRDLGADIIKGYILLERDKEGRRDWNFLMVSLENTPHLNLWFEFIESIDNRFMGIYLLSVEAENIVKNIDVVLATQNKDTKLESDSQWKFFVTHNKVGGFRQVILKDGLIIFTRLTQPVGEVNAEVIAGNIEQEMLSTIEYMKRLSFSYNQGLDVYIVASEEINNSLDLVRMQAKNIHKFTPFEVAKFFAITGAAQPLDQFGDVIMTACITSNRKHRLVLHLPRMLKINNIYNIIKYQRIASILVLLVVIVYGVIIGVEALDKYSEIENLNQKKESQQKKLDDLNVAIKKSGMDVKKINDTVILYEQLSSESRSPLPLLSRLRSAIMSPIIINEVLWENGGSSKGATAPMAAPNSQANLETVSLVLRFPEAANTKETFDVIAKKILKDVRREFPEYDVSYKKLPPIFSEEKKAGEIVFEDKEKKVAIEKTNLEATLLLVKDPSAVPPTPVVGAVIGSGGMQR